MMKKFRKHVRKPYRYIDNTIVPKEEVESAFENDILSEDSMKRFKKNRRLKC